MTVVTISLPWRRRSASGLRQHLVDDLLGYEAREDVANALALEAAIA